MRAEMGGDMDPVFDLHIPGLKTPISPSIPAPLEGYPPYPRHIPGAGMEYPRPSSLWEGQGISGNPGPITGTHRRAQIRVHPCHSPILAGLDADRCAFSVAVDPYPLTPAGEVEALRDHRRTYRLLRGELDRRDAWTIPGHPPSPTCTVLAEHRCEARIPDDWKAPPAPAPDPPAEVRF